MIIVRLNSDGNMAVERSNSFHSALERSRTTLGIPETSEGMSAELTRQGSRICTYQGYRKHQINEVIRQVVHIQVNDIPLSNAKILLVDVIEDGVCDQRDIEESGLYSIYISSRHTLFSAAVSVSIILLLWNRKTKNEITSWTAVGVPGTVFVQRAA